MFVIWLKKYDMDYMSTAIITAWEGHVDASKMSFSQRLCWFLVFAASGEKKKKKTLSVPYFTPAVRTERVSD